MGDVALLLSCGSRGWQLSGVLRSRALALELSTVAGLQGLGRVVVGLCPATCCLVRGASQDSIQVLALQSSSSREGSQIRYRPCRNPHQSVARHVEHQRAILHPILVCSGFSLLSRQTNAHLLLARATKAASGTSFSVCCDSLLASRRGRLTELRYQEFDFRVVGDGRSATARYANNSNYRNDSLIRKESTMRRAAPKRQDDRRLICVVDGSVCELPCCRRDQEDCEGERDSEVRLAVQTDRAGKADTGTGKTTRNGQPRTRTAGRSSKSE